MAEPLKIYVTGDAANRNNRRIHMNGQQLCKVYGWNEREAEEKAELIVAALKAYAATTT